MKNKRLENLKHGYKRSRIKLRVNYLISLNNKGRQTFFKKRYKEVIILGVTKEKNINIKIMGHVMNEHDTVRNIHRERERGEGGKRGE